MVSIALSEVRNDTLFDMRRGSLNKNQPTEASMTACDYPILYALLKSTEKHKSHLRVLLTLS